MEGQAIDLLVSQLMNSKKKQRRKILLLITAGSANIEEVREILGKSSDLDFQYVCTDSCSYIPELEKLFSLGTKIDISDNINDILDRVDLVILPTLSRNTLVKASYGIADNLLLTILQLSIMKEKSIIGLDMSFNPSSEYLEYSGLNKNANYNNHILERKEVLENFGVTFYNLIEFKGFMLEYNKEEEENNLEKIVDILNELLNISRQSSESIEKTNTLDDRYLKGPITYADVVNKDQIYFDSNVQLTDMAKEYINRNNPKIIKRK